jgi:hypothetical protein
MILKTICILKIFVLIKFSSINCSSFDPRKLDEVDEDKEWLKSWAHLTKYSHSDYEPSSNSVYNLDYDSDYPVYPDDPVFPELKTTYDEDLFRNNLSEDNAIAVTKSYGDVTKSYDNDVTKRYNDVVSKSYNDDYGDQSQYFSKDFDWENEVKRPNIRQQKRPGCYFFPF